LASVREGNKLTNDQQMSAKKINFWVNGRTAQRPILVALLLPCPVFQDYVLLTL